jgi:hypothetical protein
MSGARETKGSTQQRAAATRVDHDATGASVPRLDADATGVSRAARLDDDATGAAEARELEERELEERDKVLSALCNLGFRRRPAALAVEQAAATASGAGLEPLLRAALGVLVPG